MVGELLMLTRTLLEAKPFIHFVGIPQALNSKTKSVASASSHFY
jgi:hypothetical protein